MVFPVLSISYCSYMVKMRTRLVVDRPPASSALTVLAGHADGIDKVMMEGERMTDGVLPALMTCVVVPEPRPAQFDCSEDLP